MNIATKGLKAHVLLEFQYLLLKISIPRFFLRIIQNDLGSHGAGWQADGSLVASCEQMTLQAVPLLSSEMDIDYHRTDE